MITRLVSLLIRLLREFLNFTGIGLFLWELPHNHHRLQASRFTKNNQLFHREHGCLRSAFPVGCNVCAYNCIGDQLRAFCMSVEP